MKILILLILLQCQCITKAELLPGMRNGKLFEIYVTWTGNKINSVSYREIKTCSSLVMFKARFPKYQIPTSLHNKICNGI